MKDDDFADFPDRFRELAIRALRDKHRADYVEGMVHFYETDYPKAMKNFRLAAVHSVGEAEFQIGLMYFQGKGVLKSMDEAAAWFTRAATNGTFLASIFLELLKRDLDPHRQKMWLMEVFFQVGNLGFEDPTIREKQEYFEKDPLKALDMLVMAAALGHGDALSRLGEIFENGKGGITANEVVGLAIVCLLSEKHESFAQMFGRLIQTRSVQVVLEAIRLVLELVKPGNFESALQNYLRNPVGLPALEIAQESDAPASIPAMTDSNTCLLNEDCDDSITNTQQLQVLQEKLDASTAAVHEMLKSLDWIHSAGKGGASAGVLEAFAKHTALETRASLGLRNE